MGPLKGRETGFLVYRKDSCFHDHSLKITRLTSLVIPVWSVGSGCFSLNFSGTRVYHCSRGGCLKEACGLKTRRGHVVGQ